MPDAFHFTRVLESIWIPLPIGFVSHHLRQAECAEHGAHALHVPADCAGNFAGA